MREIRAAGERGLRERASYQRRIAMTVLARAARRAGEGMAGQGAAAGRRAAGLERAALTSLERRRRTLERTALTLRAHEPERVLERGYALAETTGGEPVTSAAAARQRGATAPALQRRPDRRRRVEDDE